MPIRIEVGPRDVKNNQVVLVKRNDKGKVSTHAWFTACFVFILLHVIILTLVLLDTRYIVIDRSTQKSSILRFEVWSKYDKDIPSLVFW